MGKPTVYEDDDGALNFEWVFNDNTVRFGFCIDENLSDDCVWWFASKDGEVESGPLPPKLRCLLAVGLDPLPTWQKEVKFILAK